MDSLKHGGERPGAGRKPLLTPELQEKICGFIRAGAFLWVAAQACGINRRTLYTWCKKYPDFAEAMLVASATARLTAEAAVKKTSPLFWLTHGPGRSRPGQPGWTEKIEIEVSGGTQKPDEDEDLSLLSADELRQLKILLEKARLPEGEVVDVEPT